MLPYVVRDDEYNIKNSEKGNEIRRSVSSRTLSARVRSTSEVDQYRKRGMVLPFTPLSITFDEIRYAVDMPQVQLKLIMS